MSSWLADFTVEALAGIVGVFVGVLLALIVDRRRQEREDARAVEERDGQFQRARHTVLGSVVKNTNEASRLRKCVDTRRASQLIHTDLEISIWGAVQAQFMEACHDIDERVRFAQFFDAVTKLRAFFDFHRDLLLSIAGAYDEDDPELAEILSDADERLREMTDELKLSGILIITDFGEPVHKRLLGLKDYSA